MSSGKVKKGGKWSGQVYLVRDNIKENPYTKDEIFDELKGILDEDVGTLLTCKNKLTKYQITQLIFFHEFVFFEAAGYYWTVEKDGEGIKIQMSSDRDKIIKNYNNNARTSVPKQYREEKCSRKNFKELIDYLYDVEMTDQYHYIKSNCQRFSERVYNFCSN